MVGTFRQRRVISALLLGALALGLSACGGVYPNSTLNANTSEFNAAIDALLDTQLIWGTIVFIGVEAALVYAIFRFRRRPGGGTPKQVHGNTALEITWTAIPGRHPDLPRDSDRSHNLQDAGQGCARCPAGAGDWSPVVVGVQVPTAGHHHGQRALSPEGSHRQFRAQDN
jgi:hypothetical protein